MTDNDATQTRQDDADVSKELRRTLDEHGVKWKSIDFDVSKTTLFYAGSEQYIFDDGGGIASPMLAGPLTPAQVIAATLGADEYAIEHNVDGSYKCPKCGCVVDYDIRGDDERIITMDDYVIPLNHCPKCGARTEEDE